jgi:hypothetical protein
MVEDKVHLVICTRCNSQHRYRPSLAAMRKKTPLPSERQARILKKIEEANGPQAKVPVKDWQNFKEIAGETKPLDYDPSQVYSENQALTHPTFGLGFVRKVINASKVEVVFEREVKILVMNRPRSGQE